MPVWRAAFVARASYGCIGLLFLAAGILKLHRLAEVPYVGTFEAAMTTWELIVIGVECLLAFALITGVVPTSTRSIAICVFACFIVISTYKWVHGYQTCGCFGLWEVSPAVSLLLSLISLTALLVFRPLQVGQVASKLGWRHFGILSLVLVFATSIVSIAIREIGVKVAQITSVPVFTEWVPAGRNMQRWSDGGEDFVVQLRVHNISPGILSLVGGRGAGCVVTADLPVRIAPGEYQDLRVVFQAVEPRDRMLAQIELQSIEMGVIHRRLQILAIKDLRGFLSAIAKL